MKFLEKERVQYFRASEYSRLLKNYLIILWRQLRFKHNFIRFPSKTLKRNPFRWTKSSFGSQLWRRVSVCDPSEIFVFLGVPYPVVTVYVCFTRQTRTAQIIFSKNVFLRILNLRKKGGQSPQGWDIEIFCGQTVWSRESFLFKTLSNT